MAIKEKFIVVPFRKGRGQLIIPGEVREARSEAAAERLAKSMAQYHLGAAAIAVLVDVDDEYGEMMSPRLICEFGQAVNVIDDAVAA